MVSGELTGSRREERLGSGERKGTVEAEKCGETGGGVEKDDNCSGKDKRSEVGKGSVFTSVLDSQWYSKLWLKPFSLQSQTITTIQKLFENKVSNNIGET